MGSRRRDVAADQRRGVRILLGIDHPEGSPVASEEGGQPGDLGRPEWPDDHRASEADLDHRHVAQEQRPHDAFAELGLGDEQRAKLVGRNDDRLHLLDRLDVDRARLLRERSEVGQELAREHLHLLRGAADQLARTRQRAALARADRG